MFSNHKFIELICFLIDVLGLILYQVWLLISWPIRFALSFRQKSLQDEVILVTGSAGGIGSEICLQIAKLEKSITLICWDTSTALNETLVKRLQAGGVRRVIGMTVDICNEAEVKKAYAKVTEEVGPVTILINNAGVAGDFGPLWNQNPKSVDQVFRVNLLSHFWTLQATLPTMLEEGRGHIVTICSILGHTWMRNSSAYTASKHAVRAYVKCLQDDIRADPREAKIHFTSVYPYLTNTNILSGLEIRAKYETVFPDMLTPQEVASATIKGLRRNQEHVFVPGYLRFAALAFAIYPSSLIRKSLAVFDFNMRDLRKTDGNPVLHNAIIGSKQQLTRNCMRNAV